MLNGHGWLAVSGWGRVLRHAPDAGGPGGPSDGGGSPDAGLSAPGDGEVTADPDAPEPGREPQARDGGDDEDDADDSEFDQEYHDTLKQRDPKAAKKYRNAMNRSRAAGPLLTAIRALGIDPKDSAAMSAFLRNGVTPKQTASAPAPVPAARTEPEKPKWTPLRHDEPFDETPFQGWDLNEPGNKWLHGQAKSNHETRMHTRLLANSVVTALDRIEQLEGQIKGYQTDTASERRQATSQAWRTEVDSASKGIKDTEVRGAFLDAVYGAAMREQQAGRTPDPKAIVATVLKRFQRAGTVTPADAARTTAAAQAIADRTRSLPRSASLAPNGAPGSPQRDRSQERIGDVSRRLVGKGYYGGAR